MADPVRLNARKSLAPVPASVPAHAPLSLVSADTERMLLARIRGGDEHAFEQLFRRYYGELWAFCAALVHAPDVAEECVQDVLWWVWEHRDHWVVRDSLRTYLYGAVRNRAVNVIKRRRVAERWEGTIASDARVAAYDDGGDERMRTQELVDAVERAVAAMPERRREAFTLRARHQMTQPEIARVMGITLKSVEYHMALALAAIRTEIAELI